MKWRQPRRLTLDDPDEAFNRNHSFTGSWDYFGLDEKDSLGQNIERPKTSKKVAEGNGGYHGSKVREVGTPLSTTYVIERPDHPEPVL